MTTITTAPAQCPPSIFSIVLVSIPHDKLNSIYLTASNEKEGLGDVTISPIGVISGDPQQHVIFYDMLNCLSLATSL